MRVHTRVKHADIWVWFSQRSAEARTWKRNWAHCEPQQICRRDPHASRPNTRTICIVAVVNLCENLLGVVCAYKNMCVWVWDMSTDETSSWGFSVSDTSARWRLFHGRVGVRITRMETWGKNMSGATRDTTTSLLFVRNTMLTPTCRSPHTHIAQTHYLRLCGLALPHNWYTDHSVQFVLFAIPSLSY